MANCKTKKELYNEVKDKISKAEFDSAFEQMQSMTLSEAITQYVNAGFNIEDLIEAGFKGDKEVLKSDAEFVNRGTAGYETEIVDLVNNPDKIVELAKEIAKKDTIKPKHEKELLDNLAKIVGSLKKVVPEVAVHINTEADKNGGWMKMAEGKLDVYTAIGPDNRNKSALEVYVHELYHAVTKYGIESRDATLSKTVKALQDIKNQFLDEVTEDMLAAEMDDKVAGKEQAKKMLDYFADSKVGMHEFVAYAMTNPAVMAVLKKMETKRVEEKHPDLASKLIAMVEKVFDAIVGFVGKKPASVSAYTNMVVLVDSLANANGRALEAKRSIAMERIVGGFDFMEKKVVDGMKKASEKFEKSPMPRLGTKKGWSKVAYLARMAARAVVDDKAKKVLEGAMGLWGIKPEGTMMTIIRDMSESDATQDMAERFGLVSQNIDQYREITYTQVGLTLKQAFDRELSEKENTALTDVVLDTDLSTVWYDYDVEGMLKDEKLLDKSIRDLEKEIGEGATKEDFNYWKNQSKMLGYSMVTGNMNFAQMMNAESIYLKLNSATKKDEVEWGKVEQIDKLATLYALKYTDKSSKEAVVKLLEDNKNGVDTLVAYQSAHKTKAQDTLFDTPADRRKLIKGYSKEIYAEDVDMQVAPVGEAHKMKEMGYKKVADLPKNRMHEVEQMAMYVSSRKVKQNLHRVALRYTDMARRGTSIRESYWKAGDTFAKAKAERDIAKIKVAMVKAVDEMEKGTYVGDEKDYGMAPVLDNAGRVVDFRYMMAKKNKIEVLGMDRRAINVMARTQASTYDKEQTIKFNDEIMKFIDADAKENYNGAIIGKNTKEYVRIEQNSNDEEVRDMWSVLPDSLKRKYPEGFVVRRDLMHSLLGYREISLIDAPLLNKMPEVAKYSIQVAEKVWKEIVKVAKVDIIIRVPGVIIGNVISNFMYSVISGHSPIVIAKLQMRGVADLNMFLTKVREVIRLEALVAAGKGTEADRRKVSALKNDLESNPAKDLIDEGFYMTIIEELGLDDFKSSNKFTEMLDDKLKGAPTIVRDGVNWLYINEKTSLFKTINMATQYSDFVARYAQYHLMKEKGVGHDEAVKVVRDAFINYNKPNSRLVEYLNQMGFVMFTKYFTRIQKAIKHQGKNHPIKVVMAILAQEYVVGDVEDISDQSMLTKDFGNLFYNPLDNLLRAITPSGAEAVAAAMKGI